MDPSLFTNIGFLAFLAPVILFWNQTKHVVYTIFSFFIRTDRIRDYRLSHHFVQWLFPKSKVFTFGDKKYLRGHMDHLKSRGYSVELFYLGRSFYIAFYKRFFPILIRPESKEGIRVTYFFHTINTQKILSEICSDLYSDKQNFGPSNRHYIEEVIGKESALKMFSGQSPAYEEKNLSSSPASDNGNSDTTFSIYTLGQYLEFLGADYKDIGQPKEFVQKAYYWQSEGLKFKESVKHWLENAPWFHKRNIVHRRGCLLYGKPGTGKTKMVLETSKVLDIPLIKMNISNMSEKEFIDAYARTSPPCIVLIEDIDVVFNMRENVLAKSNRVKSLISFDSFINVIGGARQYNGIYTVITTNNIEILDPSLLRAGRMDLKIEVKDLDMAGKKFIAENILSDWPELIEKTVQDSQDIVAAEFENKCIELAIEKFYEKEKA